MRITKATYSSWRMNRWWRYSCMQNRAPCSWQMHMEHKKHLSFCPGAGADAEVSHKGRWRSCEQALPSAPSGTASEGSKLDGSTLCPLMCSLGNPGTGLLLCPLRKMSLKLPEWPQTHRVTPWAAKSHCRQEHSMVTARFPPIPKAWAAFCQIHRPVFGLGFRWDRAFLCPSIASPLPLQAKLIYYHWGDNQTWCTFRDDRASGDGQYGPQHLLRSSLRVMRCPCVMEDA